MKIAGTHLRKYSSPTLRDSRNEGRNLTGLFVSWVMAQDMSMTYIEHSLVAEQVAHSLHAGMTGIVVVVRYQTRNI